MASFFSIHLASAALPDIHFSAVGDFDCGSPAQQTVNTIRSKNPNVVLALGDYSYTSTATCWLNIIQPVKSITKIAIGNHEDDDDEDYNKYISQFGLTNPYYSFDLNSYVHVLVMDTDRTSFSSGSSQFNFVKNDLIAASQNPNIKWIIVSLHKPMYTSPNGCGDSACQGVPSLRDTYHPLFDQYGVDLVLEGHVHSYQRTYPLKFNSADKPNPIQTSASKNTYSNPEGQIYVIVGTGGAGLHPLGSKISYTVTQHGIPYGILDVVISNDGSKLEAINYGNDGSVQDTFTITKSATQTGYHYDPSFAATGSTFRDSASSSSLQLAQFTVAAWFKTTSNFASDAFIVNKGGFGGGNENPGFNLNYGLYMPSDEKLRGGFETSSGANFFISSPSIYNNGLWHYGVITYDGNTIRLYVDGLQVSSLSTGGALPDKSGNQPVRVGADSQVASSFFTGNIDEVAIWNKALTAQQITDAFNGNPDGQGQVLSLPFTSTSNSPPIANNQAVSVAKNTAKSITLTASDPDNNPLAYTIVTSPTHGTVSGTPPSVTYNPTTDYTGPDSFTFKANDGTADSNIATVSIDVTTPVDSTPPTVVSTNPASGATGVSTASTVVATFSEAVQSTTVTTTTFTLKIGTSNIAGAVSSSPDGKTATFTPSSSLAASTSYTATLTTGVKDLAGNTMASDKIWSFTTASAADTTPPTVASTNPASGATGVPTSSSVAATFSESVQGSTVSTTTFSLKAGNTNIPGTVTLSGGNIATFVPISPLVASTIYTATITGGPSGVKDLAGNALASNKVWSFTTASAADTTPPTVVSTTPTDTATGVAVTSLVSADFSEAIQNPTVTTSTFNLKTGNVNVPGSVALSQDGKKATFSPSSSLIASTPYTATITTGVKDLAGNALASNKVWSFTTAATSPSTCDSNLPVSGATSSPTQNGFPPNNAIDNTPTSKWWSTFSVNPWIKADLGSSKSICSVDIAWADGNQRQYSFTISVSTDNNSYMDVFSGKSSGTTTSAQKYSFAEKAARYVKITITQSHAGSSNSLAQISEIDVFGKASTLSQSSTSSLATSKTSETSSASNMTKGKSDSKLLSNRSPLAKDDRLTTSLNEPVVVSILDNDVDPDGDKVKILSIESPTKQGGEVTPDNNGNSITYLPPSDFVGRDSFTYTIVDEDGNTDMAKVIVTVMDNSEQSQSVNNLLEQDNVNKEFANSQLPLTSPGPEISDNAKANAKPEADAGRNKIVPEGSMVTLDGSKSHDKNGKIISYIWKQLSGPPVNLEHSDTRKTSFVAPDVEQDSSLEFELSVTNEIGVSNLDVISIRVLDIPSNSGESKTNSINKLNLLRDVGLENMTFSEPRVNFPWFSSLDYYVN